MKKLFLVGALAASMAFSSSALAAVNYGQDLTNGISATRNEDGTVSVTTNIQGSTAGQLTILVLDEENPETIDDSNIMYIDQATVTGTSDATVFENMGLLNPNGAETAYIRVGGDLGITLQTTSVALVEEDDTPTGVKIVIGDVNGVYVDGETAASYVTTADAIDILNRLTSGYDKGGSFAIGDLLVDVETGTKFVYGDVNGVYEEGVAAASYVTTADAIDILNRLTSGYNKDGSFAIGSVVEAYKAE